jgi:hypothetical protein
MTLATYDLTQQNTEVVHIKCLDMKINNETVTGLPEHKKDTLQTHST